jgi:2-phospho-L-lactate/phosphoenolpyruvate guanylyltransferase
VDPALAVVVLVPVKAFADAKARLAGVLSPSERQALARWTAARVIAAAGEAPVFVVCDDTEVAEFARAHGAEVLWQPGVGLNAAVSRAVLTLRDRGVRQVVVAHGDLPLPAGLLDASVPDAITLVPDNAGDGTNVICLPTAVPFEFAYGAASFQRHLTHALSLGVASAVAVGVRHDALLGIDIDVPSDLAHPLVQEVLPSWLPTNPANPTPPPR